MSNDHSAAEYEASYKHFLKLATWGTVLTAAVVAVVVIIIT
ncbi:aa3-type cytochrome c oxidase subunit IV [Rhodovibrionaceae bacterium A322]